MTSAPRREGEALTASDALDSLRTARDRAIERAEKAEAFIAVRDEAAHAVIEQREAERDRAVKERDELRKAAIDDLDNCCGPAQSPYEWSPCPMHQEVGDWLARAALSGEQK